MLIRMPSLLLILAHVHASPVLCPNLPILQGQIISSKQIFPDHMSPMIPFPASHPFPLHWLPQHPAGRHQLSSEKENTRCCSRRIVKSSLTAATLENDRLSLPDPPATSSIVKVNFLDTMWPVPSFRPTSHTSSSDTVKTLFL